MMNKIVYVAVLMLDSNIDTARVFDEYSKAFDCIDEFISDEINIADVDFEFDKLNRTRYEGTTIFTTCVN